MTFQKRSYKFFVVILAVLVVMLLGVSTVFATTYDSMLASHAPTYSWQQPNSRLLSPVGMDRNKNLAPFTIELNIDKKGSVIPSKGTATVNGSVICSQPAYVFLWGEIERRLGRVTVRGYFYSDFRCDGKTQWSANVVNQTGPFVGGKAKVSANVFAFTDYEVDSDHADRTIILKGGPPPRPYYSSLLVSPNAYTTILTFGILSLGLVAGLVLVIGSPESLKRYLER
jgi:hypothetical protein